MFSAVVVPLDLDPHGDRALPIASRLAATAGISLDLLANRVDNAMIVVASARWTDPDRTHLRSVARRLAHHAHHPVLVVPAERVPASAP